jgi:Lrp/AsnC family leucine-responsive transcriptional regulator
MFSLNAEIPNKKRRIALAAEVVEMHPVDRQIVEILQEQGRISNVQLAERVGLSPPAVLERVRKLEEKNVITGYTALVDNKKVGLGTEAFVAVSLNLHQKDSIENFHEFVGACSSVRECYHIAGTDDYLLKVYTRDIDDYEKFLLHSLTRIKGIDRVKTMFVLSTLKREISVPITESGCSGPNGYSNGQKKNNRKNGKSQP